VSDLIPEVFKLNSRLLTAGNRLVALLRLTGAWRQVLGCIGAAQQPQLVA
jgi:hypothetical protein